ncbi:hypothetical protein OPQ81_002340 [Rhizoctonia solani]|nr:hypothetical protein OPQ81_002340 [Rhizoctonia solani]
MPEALPPSDIKSVVEKIKERLNFSKIQSMTGVSTKVVIKIRFTHYSGLPGQPGGCPLKHSASNVCHPTHLLTSTNPITPHIIAQWLSATNSSTFSAHIICWHVKTGVAPFVKPKNQDMAKDEMKVQYEFALEHQFCTLEDWKKKVQWSEKTKINFFWLDLLHYAYRRVIGWDSPS